ncbi:hypothetical protein [Actinoplanes sp. NPDC051851]|uniref:hypothetical protein n=1 Tax=Actinoplanes sp. NPDC051851 TaxID=3154753 RepID=UPI0034372A93
MTISRLSLIAISTQALFATEYELLRHTGFMNCPPIRLPITRRPERNAGPRGDKNDDPAWVMAYEYPDLHGEV